MTFIANFSKIEDPRHDINKKHNLLDILFLTATAVMSGAEGWKDIKEFGDTKLEWLRRYRDFSNGIPVDDTIARVVGAIDPEVLTRCFVGWVNALRSPRGLEQIAIDGKTLRRSFDGERSTALHSITAWSKENGLVLAQMRSKGKKNEHTSVMEIIDMLELRNAIVTVDAMNTQKKFAKKIRQKGGDYVFCVKENHKNLRQEIASYFHKMERDHRALWQQHVHKEVDGEHGRIETRHYRQLLATDWIAGKEEWEGMQTVLEVVREREIKGKSSIAREFYITSMGMDAKRVAEAIRGHWGVENNVHWVLDVTYKEDDCRIRRENAAENMALMRRFSLNLARLHPMKNSMRGKLKQAMWSDEFRSELLLGQIQCKV